MSSSVSPSRPPRPPPAHTLPCPLPSSQGRALGPDNNLCLKRLQDARACDCPSLSPCVARTDFLLSTLCLLLGHEAHICRCLFHSPAVQSPLNYLALSLPSGHLVSVGRCVRLCRVMHRGCVPLSASLALGFCKC